MPYNSIAIANHFIELAASRNQGLTPMKLQKLVFFVHGWHLALKNAPLIDEQVEAWSYGPVIRSIYKKFRGYGNQTIREKGTIIKAKSNSDGTNSYELITPDIAHEGPEDLFVGQFLEKIWDVYGKYTAIQLSNKTHEVGTPWYQVSQQYSGKMPKWTDILPEIIKEYFRGLIQVGANSR